MVVRFASAALVLGAAAVLVVAIFFGGGIDTDQLLPIGLLAFFLAGGALVATSGGLIPLPRLTTSGLAFFGLLAAFVVWSGLSVEWSFAPDLSWNMFNRELAYLAIAGLGAFVGALVPRSPVVVANGLALALGCMVAWALAGKIFPGLVAEGGRVARLRSPVGYWNVLAVLAAIGLVLGLWLATDSVRSRLARSLGAVLVYGAVVAILLTYSRSGIAIAVLAAVAWALLSGTAFETLATVALAGVAAAPALAFAFAKPGLTANAQPSSTRAHDGALFAPILLGGAVAIGVAAFVVAGSRPPAASFRRLAVLVALTVALVVACGALATSVVRAGGPGAWLHARAHEFTRPSAPAGQEPGRLGSLSSSRRWNWWQEAWRSFEKAPLAGRGAGSFAVVNRLERPDPTTVTEPHNLLLQSLSDTGIVGFLLLGGAIAAAVWAGRERILGTRGQDRLAASALAIAAAAYLVQAIFDIDWDFVAASAPAFFVVGVLVSSEARPAWRPGWALGAAAVACAAAASILVPWLAARKTDDAYAAVTRDPLAAAHDAESARSLNPLAVDPLYALGLARTQQRRLDEAQLAYVRAVRLQPHNPDTWYELAAFELRDGSQGSKAFACALASRAHELDRFDVETAALRLEACRTKG